MIRDPRWASQRQRIQSWRAAHPRRAAALTAAGLMVLCTLGRLPFMTSAPVNWDAVQFALATRSFDLARHQPHPPGYILYVGWGRLLSSVTGDPNQAFALTSLVASGLAVALLYLMGREMVGARSALVAAALFATSPLLWYYSVVALTYAVEAFFLLAVVWLCWRALQSGQARPVVYSAVLVGLAGGVRQSTLVLVLPLWAFAAARTGRGPLLRGLLVLLATTIVWLVPLVYLAGGPAQYVGIGLELLTLVGERTSVVSGGARAVVENVAHVGAGLLVGLNLGAVLLAYSCVRWGPARRKMTRRSWALLVLWSGPALAVFVLGHIGQVGYLLPVLPALFLVLAVYVEAFGLRLARALPLSNGPAIAVVAIVLAAGHFLVLFIAPSTAHALLPDPVAAAQVDVRDNDRFWAEVPPFVARYTPQEAIVLAEASPWGSFRHAGYFLSRYRVYGLGEDRRGRFGLLFLATGGTTDYSVKGLSRARPALSRPPGARVAIILDPKIAASLVQRELLVETIVTAHRSIFVLDLSRVDRLAFEFGRTFLHGPRLESRDLIPLAIRDIRLHQGMGSRP